MSASLGSELLLRVVQEALAALSNGCAEITAADEVALRPASDSGPVRRALGLSEDLPHRLRDLPELLAGWRHSEARLDVEVSQFGLVQHLCRDDARRAGCLRRFVTSGRLLIAGELLVSAFTLRRTDTQLKVAHETRDAVDSHGHDDRRMRSARPVRLTVLEDRNIENELSRLEHRRVGGRRSGLVVHRRLSGDV
ncbi:MAG TPA: hypothetical protein PLB92_14900 [Rhodoglobus sp.]|nr:hypothetical protein [Rhodoglobus sp.]